MKILVTGAAGFLGARLVRALLADRAASRIIAADTSACPIDDPRIDQRIGTITDNSFLKSIAGRDVNPVYHLAAIVSGQAEADLDLGMAVNLDATRNLLEIYRRLSVAPRFVFT